MSAVPRHRDFESEQRFLNHAYVCLNQMRDRRARLGDAGGDKKASYALEQKRREALERMDNPDSVCFGRLNYHDGRQLYLGPQGIWDDRDDLVVINWAAEQAKPFYEASPDEPLGLDVRRRFRTKREILLSIADEVFADGGGAEPTIADILLEELGRERTAEMREIAATIQKDQYRIISRPLTATTIVQGGPGTGKTAVGLHRAALLLFRYRQELTPSRVLVVGPNRVFMKYIAYVLPSLGETAADQVAVESMTSIDARRNDDDRVALIKGDERMAEVLRAAVVERVHPPDEPVRLSANGIEFTVSPDAIAAAIAGFDAKSQTYVTARLWFRAEFDRMVGAAYASAYARNRRGLQPEPLSGRLPAADRALDRIWPTISAAELVRQLLASEERLDRAGAGALDDIEKRLLFRKPVERLEQVRWSRSDVALVDEVQHLIEPVARSYGHVVLDEAQDLTPMELRMVGRRIRDGAVTVLGDLAQATGLWSYASWDEVARHMGMEPSPDDVLELTQAYRVPREIMDLALPVLQLTAPSITPPHAFRDGGAPVFLEVTRQSRRGEAVEQAAAAQGAGGTTAIIAPASLLEALRDELGRQNIAFGDAELGQLADSIELLDPASAKGLEFDHVVLVEPGAIIREGGEGRGHRELYVALTRAMRTLVCVHFEPLPWPLGVETSLHTPVEHEPMPIRAPEATEPAAPTSEPAPVPAPTVSVGEALVLARMRGLDLDAALARALVVCRGGNSEAAAATAVLDPDAVERTVVDQVLAAAANGRGPRE